jgi:hypothetical protein
LQLSNSNLQTEESQFISFEEDSEPLPPQPSLPEVAQAKVPEEIVHPQEEILAPVAVEEEDVVDDVNDVNDGEHSDVGMELTNLEATSIQPSQLFTNLESRDRRDGRWLRKGKGNDVDDSGPHRRRRERTCVISSDSHTANETSATRSKWIVL